MTRQPGHPTTREGSPGGDAASGASSSPTSGLPDRARRALERVDWLHRRHPLIAIPVAVVKKFGDDRGGHWAALVAYYGFFSLFPLLLVLATVVSFVVQGNDRVQQAIFDSALAQFPIIGEEIENQFGALEGSVAVLVIGIVGSVWAGMGVVLSVQAAMDELWEVPRRTRPGFLQGRLRALLALVVLGLATVAASVLAAIGATGGSFGLALRLVAFAGTLVLNACVFAAAFRYLTVADVRWRQVLPGALLAAGAWMALLALGTWLVDRQLRNASELYGFFGIVLGLLSWIYLGAQVTLLSAELNVVLTRRLWPRSLHPPPLTAADREVLAAQAEEEAARPAQEVHVHFHDADGSRPDVPEAGHVEDPGDRR